MASGGRDLSWSERSLYRCSCGLTFPTHRWRWIDAEAKPDVAERAQRSGPLEGFCPGCGNAATGMAQWLELRPSAEQATIVASSAARGDVVELLRQHLSSLERRGDEIPRWMLQPALEFVDGDGARADAAPETAHDAGVPKAVGAAGLPAPGAEAESRAHVGQIRVEDGVVKVIAVLDPQARRMWGTAALRARPVLLRDFGYPLVGVRLVASHVGQLSLLDGIADVAQEAANEVFIALAQDLRLDLELRSEGSSSGVRREVSAGGLERNAALCLESARAELATGEYPPAAFERALDRLSSAPMEERMKGAEHSLAPGDYRYLLSPRETWSALEHLSNVSQKENLARLLEVDGFSVEEYEATRKRVLEASVEHGICAPRRFWRRIIASGLAKDASDYAGRLSSNRAALIEEGDDLEPAQVERAWESIRALCRRKGLRLPDELREALGLPEEDTPVRPRGNPTMAAAGEIGGGAAGPVGAAEDKLRQRLLQPEQRVHAAIEALRRRVGEAAVLAALEDFEAEELLEVLPTLVDSGHALTPSLAKLLRSQTPVLRQACAITLGASRDHTALPSLVDALFNEPTAAWEDIARAIGGFGKLALAPLRTGVRQQTTLGEEEWMTRLARAMAEVALTDGSSALGPLESDSDQAVAYSARHALATLDAVRLDAARVRGDEPMQGASPTQVFARRAHEAISVPELELIEESVADVLGEADLEFI